MAVAAPKRESAPLSSYKPRIAHYPRVANSLAEEVIELGHKVGLHADEHQQFALEKSLGLRRGKWASFEVAINEPRQNGKGAILELRELAGLFLFGEKRIVHSAHEAATAEDQFVRIEGLIQNCPELNDQVKSFRHQNGNQRIVLHDGRRIEFRTRTISGTRGLSGDVVVLDEAMILRDASMASLIPILRARSLETEHGVQVWYAGSAVDQETHDHGIVWARVRERGVAGDDPDLTYLEWSAPFDSPLEMPVDSMYDELIRKATNPAYGVRISREHFDRECRMLPPRTVAVELFGVGDWPSTDPFAQGPIPIGDWLELVDERSQLEHPVCLAFDVSPDRRASIAAAGRNQNGDWHVEIGENRQGTSWLPARVAELSEHFDPVTIRAAASSPAMSAVREVEEAGVNVETVSIDEHAQACGRLVDVVEERQLCHLGSAELSDAVRGAATRPLGDAWLWSRKSSSVDISPLVAATLALDAALANQEGEFKIW